MLGIFKKGIFTFGFLLLFGRSIFSEQLFGLFLLSSTASDNSTSPIPFLPMILPGTGFIDRASLAAASAAMGLPTGDDYVDELLRSLLKCDKTDASDKSSSSIIDFDAFAKRERRREKEYHAAWCAICDHADFVSGEDGVNGDNSNGGVINSTKNQHNSTTRKLSASETLAAVRALGINSASPADALAMIALLERKGNSMGKKSGDTFRKQSRGVVGYAEFKRYAALLPTNQLTNNNAAWNWLAAATGPTRNANLETPRAQPIKQLFAGGLAGVFARTAVAPLDRARTIMQDLHPRVSGKAVKGISGKDVSGSLSKPEAKRVRVRGLTGTVGKVLREEGIKGLWRGNAVTALKVVPCNALQFAIFHQMKDWFRRRREAKNGQENGFEGSTSEKHTGLTLPERLASGSVAGAISTAVCYPLDTLKSQMAVRGGLKGNAINAARQMFLEQGGARAFYKGLGPTLLADVIGTGLGFTLYDSFNGWYQKNVTNGRKPSPAEKGIIGGFSACLCLTATQPLEVVMTRMRVQGVGGRPILYTNMAHCLRITCQREGWKSLWLGTGAAYAKIFPQLAITYYVFELVSEQLGVGGLARYDAGKRTGKIVTP